MPSQLIKIESTPDLVDQVYRNLLDAISEGSLAPGARITQEEIAVQLAVSRQPVLQALRLLKKDGFVLDAPGRGVLVAPLDVASLVQIYQVRSALDALAARLAAQAHARLDPQLISQGREAARGSDVKAMMAADARFHAAIYGASGNPLIAQSAQLHWHHIRRAMGAVLQVSTMRESIWDEHEAIAQAIADGDADKAEALIREHGEEAGHNLARLLSSALAQPAASTAP
ncbi:GntR family transcriptional regulator [Polaromonas sp. JS666]|uniref:GntR family transcriptional regulator n=1 Tax=Polaromonas sp. (strain JS666 / ATCC BAA-500) TaxID=296591 RepID=UPI000886F623|nr:GntR family transcriptional regulator [Polaromonas sp. JS666]SDM85897.1 DNA-binding transcriptional regulator, GntR family [Polaromonas sp. JS666]